MRSFAQVVFATGAVGLAAWASGAGAQPPSPKEVVQYHFNNADYDSSGDVSAGEFDYFAVFTLGWPSGSSREVFDGSDADGNGSLNRDEFRDAISTDA